LIRNPDYVADERQAGAEAVVCDLEASAGDVAALLSRAGAVVFAAGAGPGSRAPRKDSLDRAGIRRFVQVTQTEVRPSMPCLLPAVTTKIRTRSRCFPDRVTALLPPDILAGQPSLEVHFPGGGRTGNRGGAP
jgi:putative NAD(P)-binding protein